VRVLAFLLMSSFFFSFPVAAQEKQTAKKAQKKKAAAPSQNWSHFNAKAKGDLEKHEKKGKK
jgi:hypothetical protein